MRKPKFLAMTLAAALVAGAVFEAPVMTARAEETAGSTSATVTPGDPTVTPGDEGGSQTPSESGNGSGSQTPSESGNGSGSQTPSESGNGSGSQTPSESGNGSGSQTPGGESGTTDTELAAPTNVEWTTLTWPNDNNRWGAKWTVPNWETFSKLEDAYLCAELYADGISVMSRTWDAKYVSENMDTEFGQDIWESGTYSFLVYEYQIVDGAAVYGEKVSSASTQEYVAPAQRLGEVTDITWDTEQTGVLYFTPVEGDVWCYLIFVDREAEDGNKWWAGTFSVFDYELPEAGEPVRVDVSSAIQRNGEGVYYATVTARSRDIDVWANGYESDYSAPFDTAPVTKTDSDKIADAIANAENPAAAVDAVKNAVALGELATQMQIGGEVLNQIKELEEDYAETNNITVGEPVVSEAAAQLGISSSGITVIGAGFNADADSTVNLTVSVPDSTVPVPNGYKDGVQLDISLAGGNSQDGQLTMPVTVTMPVPAGVDLNKLVLWHYHGDMRDEDEVVFRNNGDGTITFTVTSFSTFLFTEETDETPSGDGSTGSDEGNTPSGDAAQPDNGNQSGNSGSSNSTASGSTASGTSSTPSVTKEKKAPVALTYVVQRGDNMYKIARKHGLTLAQLVALNPQVKNPARIYAGQVLIVGYTDGETADAANAEYYIVKKGDSLYRIAARNGLKLIELKTLNPKLFAQKFIFAGQKVRVK